MRKGLSCIMMLDNSCSIYVFDSDNSLQSDLDISVLNWFGILLQYLWPNCCQDRCVPTYYIWTLTHNYVLWKWKTSIILLVYGWLLNKTYRLFAFHVNGISHLNSPNTAPKVGKYCSKLSEVDNNFPLVGCFSNTTICWAILFWANTYIYVYIVKQIFIQSIT